MEYRFLRAFLSVARLRSFSGAADEMRIAQSAVSRQIRLLEESLGQKLLVRTSRQVALTPVGEDLFVRASRLNDWVGETFEARRRTIRVGTLSGGVESFLTRKLAAFGSDPGLSFEIRVDNQSALVDGLERGTLDIALIYDPASVKSPSIKVRKLFSERIVVISNKPLKMGALGDYPWIHMGQAVYLRKLSKSPRRDDVVTNSGHTLIRMVEAGLGIAAVPDHMIPLNSSLHKHLTPLQGAIYLASPRDPMWSARTREFIESLTRA